MIEFRCEMCDAEYRVDDDRAGMLARCKECGQDITVPSAPVPKPAPVVSNDEPASATPGDAAISSAPSAANASSISGTPAAPTSPTALASDRPSPSIPVSAIKSWSSFSTPEGRKVARLGRPFDPHSEESNRKRNIVIVGIVLIVGFLLPVCVSSPMTTSLQLSFPNIQALGESGIGWQGVFSMLFPLMAGITMLVVASWPPRKRAAVFITMIVMQLVVVVIALDGLGFGQLLGPKVNLVAIVYVLMFGMIWGLLAGCRARWYRPDAKFAYGVGVIGALCTLVLFFAPFEGSAAIANVFFMMRFAPAMGAIMILATLLIIGAALVSLVNAPSPQLESKSNIAKLTFVLMLLSFGACVLLFIVSLLDGMDNGGMIVAGITAGLKGTCWIGGMMLLVPMGLTDLMLGDAAIDYSRCLKCKYDLRAADDRRCPECGMQNPV